MADPRKLAFDILGKLKIPDPDNAGQFKTVVYQGTGPQFANWKTGLKKPRQVRAYVVQTPSNTSQQLAQRNRMTIAVAAWQGADQSERNRAAEIAKKRNIPLYNAYLSLYISEHPPVLGTIWDAGTTNWLDGTTSTLWDL